MFDRLGEACTLTLFRRDGRYSKKFSKLIESSALVDVHKECRRIVGHH